MERTEFEAALQRDGYQVVVNTMQPARSIRNMRTTSTRACWWSPAR